MPNDHDRHGSQGEAGQDPGAFPGETDDGFEGQDDGAQERVDWKERAIRAEERARILGEQRQAPQQQAPAEPQLSESQKLEKQVQELRGSLPKIDPQNPQSFWDHQDAKARLDEAREQLMEARERERGQQLQAMQYRQQAERTVQSVKARFRDRPGFAKVERQFDQMVSRMQPHVAADPNALTVTMKNLLYDAAGDTEAQGRQAPPPPPGQDYSKGARGPARRGGQAQPMQWKSERDQEVGEGIYGMTPEQYYDATLNEASASAEYNGVSIYSGKYEKGRRGGRA